MSRMEARPLGWFEVPWPHIEPMLRVLRLSNTALDALFYDVGAVITARLWHSSVVAAPNDESARTIGDDFGTASGLGRAFNLLDIESLSNPEGTILVVDASRPPYVTSFSSVSEFLERTTGPCQALIPALFDQNPCAQSRLPIDLTSSGRSTNRFHARQH
jgi:hypothetical protein